MCELHTCRGSGGDYAGGIARAVLTDEQLEGFGAACPAYGGWGRAKTVSKMLRAPGSLEAVTLTPLHALHPADADHLLRLGVNPGDAVRP
jgi:hypothetical protein